jgi:hypothetical protein
MIVYYFTSAKYGIDNLKHKRLKISNFLNVNDPFELLGVELGDKKVRNAANFEKNKISEEYGLICFSEDKYNPVQWAHYGDNHKCVCLGFEIQEELLQKVKYVSERLLKKTIEESEFNKKILTTKFSHWNYEKERRLIIKNCNFPEDSNGIRFKEFDTDIVLKEIYIGCKSKLTYQDITSSYSSANKSVVVKMTRPAFKTFRIVWDKRNKSTRT